MYIFPKSVVNIMGANLSLRGVHGTPIFTVMVQVTGSLLHLSSALQLVCLLPSK